MSKLKSIREIQNLTQEEVSEKSGVSVRTIQRIESGKEPKGYTLRVLAKALNVEEDQLLFKESVPEKSENSEETKTSIETLSINYSALKLINLSSIPFTLIPPLNILVPLILMQTMKQKNKMILFPCM